MELNHEEIVEQIDDHLKMLRFVGQDSYEIITMVVEDEMKIEEYLEFGKKLKLLLALVIHQPFVRQLRKVFKAD